MSNSGENQRKVAEFLLQIKAIQLSPENPFSLILVFLTVVIVAPIGEEMVFRGFLQRFLETSWRDITRAILVSSLFFTLIHFNPYWAIQIYLMGLVLGYLSWLTKSIYPSFFLLILINSLPI